MEHPSLISAEKCGGTQQIAVTPSRQSGLIIVTLLLTGDQVPRAHHRQSSYIEQGAIKRLNCNTTFKFFEIMAKTWKKSMGNVDTYLLLNTWFPVT